jgi:hypothetical protein
MVRENTSSKSNRSKSSKNGKKNQALDKADNLYHEGLVGLQMNMLANVFPCFIHTLKMLKESEKGNFLIELRHEKETELFKFKQLDSTPSIELACRSYGKQGLMLEYIDGHIFKSVYKTEQFQHELIPVLFQIYYALWMLGPRYTHYDLHTGNVMLTRPKKDGCVMFEYVLPNGEKVQFLCSYVAKIIDYGRSYIEGLKKEVDLIKRVHECNNEHCGVLGNKCGFRNYQNPKHPGLGFRRPNVSHDLRLLNYAVRHMKTLNLWGGPDVLFHQGGFSSEEINMSGLDETQPNGGFIQNVADAGKVLAKMVSKDQPYFKDMSVIGLVKVDAHEVDGMFKTAWSFKMANMGGRRAKSRRMYKRRSNTRRKRFYHV